MTKAASNRRASRCSTRDSSGAYTLTLPVGDPTGARLQARRRRRRREQGLRRRRRARRGGDDRRAAGRNGHRRRQGRGRAGAGRRSFAAGGAAPGADISLPLAIAAGLRRRPDPQPDAVRVPGAVAQGAAPRTGPRQRPHASRCRASRSPAASSRRSSRWPGCCSSCAPPASSWAGASSCNRRRSSSASRSCSSCWRSIFPACSSSRRWFRPRRPAGRRSNPYVDAVLSGILAVVIAVALHGAVHGRGAGLRAVAVRRS